MSENTPPQPQGTPVQPPGYSAPPAYSGATPPYAAQPPAYQQPGYQEASYPAPAYGYPTTPRTNPLAIIGMIASIAGFILILPFVGSLAGAIMGHISLGQIKRNGDSGRGMALTAVILGWVGVALAIVGAIIIFGLIAYAASTRGQYSA